MSETQDFSTEELREFTGIFPPTDDLHRASAELLRLRETASPPAPDAGAQPVAFQARVQPWMMACFGPEISGDREERNHRFLEEALELVQACGCTASEAHQLVDYTFARDVGEPSQETGGVMVTLAALCLANGLDMHEAAEVELARIWTKVETIRAKQVAKPKHSPLPTTARAHASSQLGGEITKAQVHEASQAFVISRDIDRKDDPTIYRHMRVALEAAARVSALADDAGWPSA